MQKIYLDNAATTCLDKRVAEAMTEVMQNCYGNPSSIHGFGREARARIEKSRKKVASIINASPSEVFFTSGGTEADNMAIRQAVVSLNIDTIITTAIEHHAVLHTVEELSTKNLINAVFLPVNLKGETNLDDLEKALQKPGSKLVSIMHANNEIGTVYPIKKIGELCRKYGAYFHSDTVQTIGHFPIDVQAIPVDFITCSAHKLHGPKGVGFLYINPKVKIQPFITGGAQERNMRAGTENIYNIIGLAKALELANENMVANAKHIRNLKNTLIQELKANIPEVQFNGDISDNSLYTVLNVNLPYTSDAEMFLMKLDIKGIAASGGSACSSGSNAGSHVLQACKVRNEGPSIRFSFSHFNTEEEIRFVANTLIQSYKSVTKVSGTMS